MMSMKRADGSYCLLVECFKPCGMPGNIPSAASYNGSLKSDKDAHLD